MKQAYYILSAIVLTTVLAIADYTVENDSIVVGYPDDDGGGCIDERAALEYTLNNLGFSMYMGQGNVADYVTNDCQLLFHYPGGDYDLSGWSTEMTSNGRGYIQTCDWGWDCFNFSYYTIPEGSTVTIGGIDQSHELTTVPNTIPTGWTTLGFWTYGYDSEDYIAYTTEGSAPDLGTASQGGYTANKALSVKDVGLGRGVFHGWINYGDQATTEDIDLIENAIIYAAQPPHADSGGPYSGYVDTPVTLDASASTDNGTIDLYEWDIDDDSTYDFSTTDPTYDYTWTSPYNGDIHVRCTDNLGCKSVSTTTANINPADIESKSLGVIKAEFR